MSTIHTPINRLNIGEISYEYHSQNITNNKRLLKYEIIYKDSILNNNNYHSSYTQTDVDIEQIDKQIPTNLDLKKTIYEYININKKYIADKTNKKKLDDKEEEKKLDDNSNKGENIYSLTKGIAIGTATTLTGEFILFVMWSAYFYWHQNSIMAKHIEKITEDLEKLLNIEPTIIFKRPNKLKSIFDKIYEEDEEKKEEDNYPDIYDKLINFDTPIYHNKTECKLVEPPKILKEIVVTPFLITSSSKQINFLIKPDSEHSLIYIKNFNECQNLEASNSYIDAIEI